MLNLINGSRIELAEYIKRSKRKLYFWGAGVLLQTCVSQFVMEYELSDQIAGCTDSDVCKWGRRVAIADRQIPIINPKDFLSIMSKDKKVLLIITNSYFGDILKNLDSTKEMDGVFCVIMPLIYLENPIPDNGIFYEEKENVIPRKLHYCWFGGGEMPHRNTQCIETWKKYCPDYEIICWNESNTDLESSPWVRYMYQNQKWAFVSDYVRAEVLYQYGGIYLDTDVELVRDLSNFMQLEAFGGFEGWPVLNTGGGCGSIPEFWLWKEIMELKDGVMENTEGTILPMASGYYDTFPLIKRGLKTDGTRQKIDGFTIFPSEYFHPYDYVSCQLRKTPNTHGIHHFNWSWADDLMKSGVRKKDYCNIIMRTKKMSELAF